MKEKIYQSISFKKISKFIFSLKYFALFSIVQQCLSSECNYTYPIKKNDRCIEGECTSNEFNSKICTVENDIIKNQWLTSMIQFSGIGYDYTMIETTPKGDLIAGSTKYSQTLKYYYGLKKNGRPYFVNSGQETPFATTDSSTKRLEGNIFGIKINGTDNDKEYIIAFGNGEGYFELYDFKDNDYLIHKVEGKTFFNTGYNYFRIAAIFKMKTEDDYYIIGIMAQTKPSYVCNFVLMKLLFNSINIESNNPITKTETLQSDDKKSYMSSCFESENNYIICFYKDDSNNYIMVVYNQKLELQKSDVITSTSNDGDHFFKCVHFTEDTGAFLFYDTNFISVKFKKYYQENISDHFNRISQITIANNNFKTEVKMNDMIKVGDKKFCFITIGQDKRSLNLIVVNSYDNVNIKIRYYIIRTYNLYIYEFTEQLKSTLYNGLIALASNGKFDNGNGYGTLIIFSYPNSTDFNIDISDNLTSLVNPIIKLYEKCKIENNIFGYIFKGIQIYNFSDGLKLLYESDGKEIIKNEIISNDTNIELLLTKNLDIQNKLKIEYIMVLTEPEYDIYNLYPETIDKNYCGTNCEDERDIFAKSLYYGRTSYVDISFDKNIISNICGRNCAFCLKNSGSSCIICKFLYELLDNGEKKCLREGEVPKTKISTDEMTIIISEKDVKPTEVVTNKVTDLSTETTIFTKETNIQTGKLIVSTDITSSTGLTQETILSEIPTISPSSLISTKEITIPQEDSTTPNKESIMPTEISKGSADIEIPSEESKLPESTIPNKYTNIITENKNIHTEYVNDEFVTESIIEEKIIYLNNCTNEDIIQNRCNAKISNSQMESIKDNILNKNYTKENILIKTKNVIVQLSTTKDQENSDNPDVSSINLGDCENILKKENNIPLEESLIIYKTDIKIDGTNTYVQYEVYDPINLNILDLGPCSNEQISLNVPIVMDIEVETLYFSLEKSGYNLFNKSDSFYNDICATYTSENGTDVLLSDRKKDIYTTSQRKAICQAGCDLQLYNSTNKKAKCLCSISTKTITDFSFENIFNKKEIEKKFFESLSHSNFRVLKCYKLILDFSKIKKNIGQILMSFIFIIIIILLIIFCILDHKNLNKNIKFLLDIKSVNRAAQERKSISKKGKRFSVQYRKSLKLKSNEKIKEKIKGKAKDIVNPKRDMNKQKTKKIKNSPPKRKKFKSNTAKINNSTSRKLSKKQINNNILLNVQVINQKQNRRKSSIFNPLNKIIAQKKNSSKFKNNRASILSNANSRKSLKNSPPSLSLIKRNSNLPFNKKEYRVLNDQELNTLKYELAIFLDKRTYFQYYWSLLKQKQLILFTFFLSNDYNLLTLKISLFLISFCLYFTINGFFFTDETMHKVYEDNGSYDLLSKIPQILYSTIVSTIINMILKTLSLSEKSMLEIKEEKNKNIAIQKSEKAKNLLKCKFMIFFILSILFMGFFWYFISCFCAVFINTQIILIKDTAFSFSLSMLYPFVLNFFPGIFRIPSLRAKNKNKECLYNFSKIIAFI